MMRPTAAPWGFPYRDHRTVAEIDEAAARESIMRTLGASHLTIVRSSLPDTSCNRCGARGWCEHRRAAA